MRAHCHNFGGFAPHADKGSVGQRLGLILQQKEAQYYNEAMLESNRKGQSRSAAHTKTDKTVTLGCSQPLGQNYTTLQNSAALRMIEGQSRFRGTKPLPNSAARQSGYLN